MFLLPHPPHTQLHPSPLLIHLEHAHLHHLADGHPFIAQVLLL